MPKGITLSKEHKEKLRQAKLKNPVRYWSGKKRSKETIEKLKKSGKRFFGEKGRNWRGDAVKYRGLHMYIQKILGKPKTCEFCGKTGLAGHKIHWASINNKYNRNPENWIRLCAKCHKKLDTNKITIDLPNK